VPQESRVHRAGQNGRLDDDENPAQKARDHGGRGAGSVGSGRGPDAREQAHCFAAESSCRSPPAGGKSSLRLSERPNRNVNQYSSFVSALTRCRNTQYVHPWYTSTRGTKSRATKLMILSV
jgi:hypothetical protein